MGEQARPHRLRLVVAIVAALVVAVVLAALGVYWFTTWRVDAQQDQLQPFYDAPSPLTGSPGDVIRSEPADQWNIEGATATRVLYVTTDVHTGAVRAASGTIWVPQRPTTGPRKIIAWAHPTVGLDVSCAPSRDPGSLQATEAWIQQMVSLGWIVTATDYAGLGTPPPYTYLLGEQEATDVVNSVRAARNLPGANAGRRWGVFGHSQGGHASLFTAHLGPKIAPELDLVGAAAAAPAADLYASIAQQWNQPAAWVIGPEIVVSWPDVDPALQPSAVVTQHGLDATQSEALDCLTSAGLVGLAHQKLAGQDYFARNPFTDPAWAAALRRETPRPTPPRMPVFVAQGTADEVVLANSTARMQEIWCKAGSNLTMEWLGGINHGQAGKVSGPAVVDWFAARFAGQPTQPNCSVPPPVAPFVAPPG